MQRSLAIKFFLLSLSIIPCASLIAAEPEQLFTQQPTVTPALAEAGDYNVGVRSLELTHAKQRSAEDLRSLIDRTLKVEIWYPADVSSEAAKAIYIDQTRSGRAFSLIGSAVRGANSVTLENAAPLIVLSHGYTGYRSQFFPLGEHLASHGYVVASIDHTDSTNADIDFSKDPGAGFFSTLLNRARDQQFVLDTLNSPDSEWSSVIDKNRAAVLGYSMGGFGALNTVGGCYDFPNAMMAGFGLDEAQAKATQQVLNICNAGRETADPRWQAYIAIAPWGGEQGVHTSESLASIKIPGLFIAGELDDVSGYRDGVAKLFEQTRENQTRMLVFENARHNIGAHPAPKAAYTNDLDIGHYFEPAWNSETISRINNHMVLAFLNCHVHSVQKSCEFLPERVSSDQMKNQDGKLSAAWPGFPERWGTGLMFLRNDPKELFR